MQSRYKDLVDAIINTGYATINQPMLKQPYKHPQQIWNLIVHLCKWSSGNQSKPLQQFNVKFLQYIDVRTHDKAIKFSNQCNFISDLFCKLGMTFQLSDFFVKTQRRGEAARDRILNIINRLLKLGLQRRVVLARLEPELVELEGLRREAERVKRQSERASAKLKETQVRKGVEEPEHVALLAEERELQRQIMEEKQRKANLMRAKQMANQMHEDAQRDLNDKKHSLQEHKMKLQRLKGELVKNIPQIKQQRLQVQQDFNKQQQRISLLQQHRSVKLSSCNDTLDSCQDLLKLLTQKSSKCMSQFTQTLTLQTTLQSLTQTLTSKKQQLQLSRLDNTRTIERLDQLKKYSRELDNLEKSYEHEESRVERDLQERRGELASKEAKMGELRRIKKEVEDGVAAIMGEIEATNAKSMAKEMEVRTALSEKVKQVVAMLEELHRPNREFKQEIN